MSNDIDRYNKMVNKLIEIGVETVGFSYDNFLEIKAKSLYDTKITFKCANCGENFKRNYGNMIKEDRSKLCLDCCKIHRKTRIMPVDELRKRIESKGLKLISEKYTGENCNIKVMCACGNIYETTYASIRNSGSNGICMCRECVGNYNRNYFRMPFCDVVKYLSDNGCEMLSNESDYVNIFSEIRFIARCGHEHKTTFQSFKNSKYKICDECIKSVHCGENAYNWKGGYDSESTRFRKTYEFKQWVKKVYKRDNYICQHCKLKKNKLNSHHLNGYNWDIKNRTNVNNGITLCVDCHNEFHNIYGRGNNTKEQFEEWNSN